MKKRNIMFITSIVLIVVLCFAATSALAVTRTNHYDSYTSTKASSSLSMRQCCSPGRLSSYLRTRGTQRLILNPGSSNGYVYSGATGGGWTVTTINDFCLSYQYKLWNGWKRSCLLWGMRKMQYLIWQQNFIPLIVLNH